MAIISPPSEGKERVTKASKNYLSHTLSSRLREVILTADGRQLSVAEALSERLVSIALYAESNQDAISAAKIIFDRAEGRPQVIKDDSVKEIPKVVIRLNGTQFEDIEEKSNGTAPHDPDDDEPMIMAEMDDGRTYLG